MSSPTYVDFKYKRIVQSEEDMGAVLADEYRLWLGRELLTPEELEAKTSEIESQLPEDLPQETADLILQEYRLMFTAIGEVGTYRDVFIRRWLETSPSTRLRKIIGQLGVSEYTVYNQDEDVNALACIFQGRNGEVVFSIRGGYRRTRTETPPVTGSVKVGTSLLFNGNTNRDKWAKFLVEYVLEPLQELVCSGEWTLETMECTPVSAAWQVVNVENPGQEVTVEMDLKEISQHVSEFVKT